MADRVELKTDRLLLRPYRLTDVDDLFKYRSDIEWARFLPHVPQPYTRAAAEKTLARNVLESWETDPTWAIVFNQRLTGGIWLMGIQDDIGELGYELSREHWGNGLMVEAAGAVVDWVFAERRLEKISARTDARHKRSLRVMEKVGMTREGLLRGQGKGRGERIDQVVYGILREEWGGRQLTLTVISSRYWR